MKLLELNQRVKPNEAFKLGRLLASGYAVDFDDYIRDKFWVLRWFGWRWMESPWWGRRYAWHAAHLIWRRHGGLQVIWIPIEREYL